MESEQFSLCWNNFHNNLSTGFQALFKDEDLVDVTLAAEGRYIKAHKTVLSVCSSYFKELFRVNPCKHPIVILHDVNYSALNNVLQFMYQGEVSVSQEEVPTFMRIAEIFKIKGLTDNTNCNINNRVDNSNGFSKNVDSPATSYVGVADRQSIMKRTRPHKKIIKPIQHLKPLELSTFPSPSSQQTKSPPPYSVKQPRIDDTESKDYAEPLIEPKLEPVDTPHDDEFKKQSYDNDKIEINAMLDASLGESSDHSMNYPLTKSSDASSPERAKTMTKATRIYLERFKEREVQADEKPQPKRKRCAYCDREKNQVTTRKCGVCSNHVCKEHSNDIIVCAVCESNQEELDSD